MMKKILLAVGIDDKMQLEPHIVLLLIISTCSSLDQNVKAKEKINQKYPLGKPGFKLSYSSKANELPGSVVSNFELILGEFEERNEGLYQWLFLVAEKENKQNLSITILASAYPTESFKIDQQNHNCCGGYSGNAVGLAQSHWPEFS